MAKAFFALITSILMAFSSFAGFFEKTPETDFTQRKNVIFMIGDGMGFNSIAKARYEENLTDLALDSFPLTGASKTRSFSNTVTDSAAGGSALATANRITNNTVGVYPGDTNAVYSYPMNLCELAVSQNKAAGVITTDSTSGATPASFSTHTSARGNEEDITAQQLSSDLDLIWGAATASGTAEAVAASPYTMITNKAEMDALTSGTKSFGQFNGELWHKTAAEGMPTLAEMTTKAIDLLDDDEDGFFLMVEGAHIDKNSHSNNGEGMKDALVSFDDAVRVALDYAEADGNTLVIVTADHETGAITFKNGQFEYTSGSHSNANVPLLVYGCDNFIKQGEAIKNKEISRRVACVMGEKNFPIQVFVDNK